MKSVLFSIITLSLLAAVTGVQAADVSGDTADAAPETFKLKIKGVDGPLADNVSAYLQDFQGKIENGPGVRSRIQKSVQKALRAYGYYRPQMKFVRNGSTVTLNIEPGQQVLMGESSVNITGPGAEMRPIARSVRAVPQAGTPLNHADYDDYKAKLSGLAARYGYFNAEFLRSQLGVSLANNEARWLIDFETGERFRFGNVTYLGSQIDERFLQNMQTFAPGDPYDSQTLAEFNRRLSSTGWFQSVVISPDFEKAREDKDLAIPFETTVVPRKANAVELKAGFETDVGPFTGVTWEKPWVNRRGHNLTTSLNLSPVEQTLEAAYKLPRLTNPLEEFWAFTASLDREDLNDTQSNAVKFGISRHWEPQDTWQKVLTLNMRYDDFTQGETRRSTFLLYPSASISRTRQKGGMMPYWGESYRYSVDFSSKYTASQVDFLILQAQHTFIRSIARKHRFVMRANAGWIQTNQFEQIPPDLRFFAGGDRSLRGYGYKKVSPKDSNGDLTGAEGLATASLEYQYNVTGDWWGAVFFDAGEAVHSFNSADLKKGAGAGIRWKSPVGPVKFDIARPVGDPDHKGLSFYIGIGSEL